MSRPLKNQWWTRGTLREATGVVDPINSRGRRAENACVVVPPALTSSLSTVLRTKRLGAPRGELSAASCLPAILKSGENQPTKKFQNAVDRARAREYIRAPPTRPGRSPRERRRSLGRSRECRFFVGLFSGFRGWVGGSLTSESEEEKRGRRASWRNLLGSFRICHPLTFTQ